MPGASTRALTYGVVPHTDDPESAALLGDFCALLSMHAERVVEPFRASSPEELAVAFGAGQVDLAWCSPSLFLVSDALASARPLVSSVREGLTGYHSVVFVRADSHLLSLSHLPGHRAAWVSETSTSGFIFPRLALAARGLDPSTALSAEFFYGTHGAVAAAVAAGETDVGATFAVFAGGTPTRELLRAGFHEIEDADFRVLFATDFIPSDLVVVHPRVAAADREALRQALLGLPHEGPLAEATRRLFGADGYHPFDSKSLQSLAQDIEAGRQLGLL